MTLSWRSCRFEPLRAYRADLYGIRIPHAILNGADLSYADLERADLSGADLIGANLEDADLIGADLSRTNLALTPHKYQKSHSESKFPIFINMFFLLDAPHLGV